MLVSGICKHSVLLSRGNVPCVLVRHISDSLPQNYGHADYSVVAARRVPRSKAEFLAKMLFMPSQSPPESKLLKVAVLGFPNAGKSSLVNMLTKWRVCAVSGKAHTTRSKQTVVFTKDNIQLAFVDLPGLVSRGQVRQFKLEKTFIRDPHAAIFDADLNSSNKYSRDGLHPEILKTLHFFPDKESVLVLNKVDTSSGNRTRLLETTRRLTAGVVGGITSHQDAFTHKFIRRALLDEQSGSRCRRPSIESIIHPLLPLEAHEAVQKCLSRIEQLKALIPPPTYLETIPSAISLSPRPACEVETPRDRRLVTDIESQTIEDFFQSYKPATTCSETDSSLHSGAVQITTDKNETVVEVSDEVYLDSILDCIKEQLMLKSATREEVILRRQQWRQLAIQLTGVKHWDGFRRVFMVSSATGEGIDGLREYLMERARPDRKWLLSPALVTDQEPSELIRMCLWAHCLDQLPQEVPYGLSFVVDDCERVKRTDEEDGDDRIYIHARIRCPNERAIKKVLGPGGATIRTIAGAVKCELSDMFAAPTVVKLTAESTRPSKSSMRRLKKAADVGEVFPDFGNGGPGDRLSGIETVCV